MTLNIDTFPIHTFQLKVALERRRVIDGFQSVGRILDEFESGSREPGPVGRVAVLEMNGFGTERLKVGRLSRVEVMGESVGVDEIGRTS